MKLHEKIFRDIEIILKNEFSSRLIKIAENDDVFLEIKNSNFWIKSNKIELTIGFGSIHGHFSEDYENLNIGINRTFNLLTNKIKVTNFIKGNIIYKTISEIQYSDLRLEEFGSAIVMFYPFWKKTETEIKFFDKLIEADKINQEFEKLKQHLSF